MIVVYNMLIKMKRSMRALVALISSLCALPGCVAASNSLSPRQWGCRPIGRELKRTHELISPSANPGSAAPGYKSGPLSWLAKIASARARVSRVCASLANQAQLILQTLKENDDDTRFA